MNRFLRFAFVFAGSVCVLAVGASGCRPSEASASPVESPGASYDSAREGATVGSAEVGTVSENAFPAAGTDIFTATSDVSVYVASVGETVTVHLEGQIVVERRDPVRNQNGPREIAMEVTSLELSGPMVGEEEIITIRGGKQFGLPVRGIIRSLEKDRDFPAISAFPMQFEILVPAVFGFEKPQILRHTSEFRFMEVAKIDSIPPVGDIFVNVNTDPLAFYDVNDTSHETPVILLQPGVVHDVLAFQGQTQGED